MRIKRVFSIITGAIFAALIIFAISGVIQRYVLHRAVVQHFGYGSAVVLSGSMSGALEIDDLVITRATGDYELGDIIIFQGGGGMVVTHRIIETDERGFITKGDANNAADPEPVPRDAVLGEVVRVIRGGGRISDFVRSPVGIIAILLVCFVLTELPYLIEYIKKRRNRKGAENENVDIKE